jgi:hypothetical protein
VRRIIRVGICLLHLEGLRRRVQVRHCFCFFSILVRVRSVASRVNGSRDTTQNSVRMYLNDDMLLISFRNLSHSKRSQQVCCDMYFATIFSFVTIIFDTDVFICHHSYLQIVFLFAVSFHVSKLRHVLLPCSRWSFEQHDSQPCIVHDDVFLSGRRIRRKCSSVLLLTRIFERALLNIPYL